MSTRLVTSEVLLEEEDDYDTTVEAMVEKLEFYAKNHLNFSFKIERNKLEHKVIVKTVTLDDNAN